jgi:transcriptional regulator with XRE-family HTH domain
MKNGIRSKAMTQVTTVKRSKKLSQAQGGIRRKVLLLRKRLGAGGKPASRNATAKALDVSQGSIYNWEHDVTTPRRSVVRKIEALLREPPTAVVKLPAPKAARRGGVGSPAATTAEKLAIMADAIARCGGVEGAKAALARVELALA